MDLWIVFPHHHNHLFHMSHTHTFRIEIATGLDITELLFREIIEFVLIQCRNQVHCKRNEWKTTTLCVGIGIGFRLRTQSTGNFLINSIPLSLISTKAICLSLLFSIALINDFLTKSTNAILN